MGPLPISRNLAKMLGGRVSVASQPGVGSTFSAIIPIDFETRSALLGERTDVVVSELEPAVDVSKHQVPVVEDDPTARALYETYLRKTGFQTLAAASIRMAREILERVKPLAIILDILMPGEDSWRCLADLKSAEVTRQIPIIVGSVLNERDRALAIGAEDYCVKPVDRARLLGALKDISRRAPVERVLIIDDEEVARYILKGHLADTKYSVLEACDGPIGLALAREARPDAIFLDLVMPGMTGFEVLHRLKADEATRAIPVVVSTSKVLDEDERRALNGDVLAILSKDAPSRDAALAALGKALRRVVESNART